jgi:hypothetical protein
MLGLAYYEKKHTNKQTTTPLHNRSSRSTSILVFNSVQRQHHRPIWNGADTKAQRHIYNYRLVTNTPLDERLPPGKNNDHAAIASGTSLHVSSARPQFLIAALQLGSTYYLSWLHACGLCMSEGFLPSPAKGIQNYTHADARNTTFQQGSA